MVWEMILEKITRIIFGLICHQDPTILMKVDSSVILLCPRCMGLHLGFIFSFIVLAIWPNSLIKVAKKTTWVILTIAIGSMPIDWGLGGYFGLYGPTSFSRLLTGLASGSALSVLVTSYRHGLVSHIKDSMLYLTGFQIGCLIFFSFCVGLLVLDLCSCLFLSSILFLSVVANALIAMHTISLILRIRLFRRENNISLPSIYGGSQ